MSHAMLSSLSASLNELSALISCLEIKERGKQEKEERGCARSETRTWKQREEGTLLQRGGRRVRARVPEYQNACVCERENDTDKDRENAIEEQDTTHATCCACEQVARTMRVSDKNDSEWRGRRQKKPEW